MEIEELKGLIEAQGRAFEEFKANNDAAIEAKAKGVADPLIEAKAKTINDALDELGEKFKKLETKANRPGAGKDGMTDDELEHKAAYNAWMRKGAEAGLIELERKALSAGSSADGGFAVPKVIDTEIVDVLVNISPIRSIATVRQISTPNFNILADINGTQSGWVGETAARTATNTPQLANITPTMGELYANPQASQQVLDDTMFDIEAWLAQSVAEEFARAEGAAFIAGTGTNQPTGFLAGAAPAATVDGVRAFGTLQYVPSGQAAAMPTSLDTIINLVQALKAGHRQGAVFVASKALVGALRQYKSTTNDYLWQPSIQAGVPSAFMGYPVIEAEDMPAVAANAFPLAFGNFKAGYIVVDRMGVRTLRDPFTNKPFVGFYTTKRVGGIVTNSEAIKLLKIAVS